MTIALSNELIEVIKKVAESLDISEEEAIKEFVRDWVLGTSIVAEQINRRGYTHRMQRLKEACALRTWTSKP